MLSDSLFKASQLITEAIEQYSEYSCNYKTELVNILANIHYLNAILDTPPTSVAKLWPSDAVLEPSIARGYQIAEQRYQSCFKCRESADV